MTHRANGRLSGSSSKWCSIACTWSAALPRFAAVFPHLCRFSMYFWFLTCWTLFGWSSAGRSTIRGLRLFVADGFSDGLEVCSSTPDICRRRIFAVAVRSVSWMLACYKHTKGYKYIATISGKKLTNNSSIDSLPLLNIVYDLPYRVWVKYKYL